MPLHFKKATLFFIAFSFFLCSKSRAQSSNHRTETWSVNYMIDRVECSGGYTMVTGSFNQVGPYTGSGVLVNAATSALAASFPKINETTYASVPDGNGGWFVGGSFDLIDDSSVKHIAHFKSDNTLDTSWKPNVSGPVYAMALSGTTLYIGGTFQSVNGQTRNFIAALNAADGSLTNWNPDCNSVVRSISPNGSTVYIGGDFTTVGGLTRNKIAAIDASTGTATSWNPSVTGNTVSCIVTNSTTVFLGGNFTDVGGSPRSSLAAVDINTGNVLAWNANPAKAGGAKIFSLALSSNTLYAGGDFTSIDGQSISNLAAVDAASGTALAWDAKVSSAVIDLSLSGSTLYTGGEFNDVNGTVRQFIAAINTSDASLQSFNIVPNGFVKNISSSGQNIFVGGDFNGVNWTDKYNFALFNDATNAVWPFDIALDALGRINTIAVKDNVLYIGGQFTQVNGQARLNLAALDLSDGNVLSWNPSVTDPSSPTNISEIFTLKIKDNLLYAGGSFMEVNGQAHESLAAIDLTTGIPAAWHPTIGDGTTASTVYSIDFLDNVVYVAGQYNTANGQSRGNLSAFDLTSGNLLTWDPQSDDQVNKIRVSPTTAYVVGNFDAIGATVTPGNFASIDLASGNVNNWFPDLSPNYASDVALTGSDIIIAGYFDKVGTEFRTGLALFSQATGELNAWNPDVGSTEGGPMINSVDVTSNRIHVGGAFDNVGYEYRSNYAEYDMCSVSPSISLNGSTLTSTPADSYQWYLNNQAISGATGQSLDILLFEYGVYSVDATLSGCTGHSNDFVYLITGTDPDAAGSKVFPNPIEREFYIKTPEDGTARIFDMTGHEVLVSDVKSSEQNRIDAQHLTAGMYLLKIQTQSNTAYHKIFKKF